MDACHFLVGDFFDLAPSELGNYFDESEKPHPVKYVYSIRCFPTDNKSGSRLPGCYFPRSGFPIKYNDALWT